VNDANESPVWHAIAGYEGPAEAAGKLNKTRIRVRPAPTCSPPRTGTS